MKVFLAQRAKKFLDGVSPELRRRLEGKISELLITPYPSGYKKLKGAPNAYRLRVGDYRVGEKAHRLQPWDESHWGLN